MPVATSLNGPLVRLHAVFLSTFNEVFTGGFTKSPIAEYWAVFNDDIIPVGTFFADSHEASYTSGSGTESLLPRIRLRNQLGAKSL